MTLRRYAEANGGWLRPLGALLTLPLAGAVAASFAFTATCEYDCGDMGGRGLFLLVLLCTPLAAAGVLVLAATAGPRRHRLVRLAGRLFAAGVAICTLALCATALAAAIDGVSHLTSEPEVHRLGATEPSDFQRDQAREEGIFLLAIATVLTAMTVAAVLALWAAWRQRR